jgi:hypothetical protein
LTIVGKKKMKETRQEREAGTYTHLLHTHIQLQTLQDFCGIKREAIKVKFRPITWIACRLATRARSVALFIPSCSVLSASATSALDCCKVIN